jgi:Domain of unknown function (DUF4335)
MSINRQFSLPNCVFILEGLSNASEGTTAGSRPELSVLTRFECYFAREKQALVGGLDLLQGLIAATNDCVQAWISGVPSAHRKLTDTALRVELIPANGGFDLTVPEDLLSQGLPDPSKDPEKSGIQLHLSAVQLFDLMEAIDQLAADQQTLPHLQNPIRSRSRQETRSTSLVLEQTAPIAIGTVSVAAAAAALFFMPIPKAPEPKEPETSPSPAVQTIPIPPTAAPPVTVPPATPTPKSP